MKPGRHEPCRRSLNLFDGSAQPQLKPTIFSVYVGLLYRDLDVELTAETIDPWLVYLFSARDEVDVDFGHGSNLTVRPAGVREVPSTV